MLLQFLLASRTRYQSCCWADAPSVALSSSPCAITHLHLQGCTKRQKTLQLPVCICYHRRAGLTGIILCYHCWQGHFQKGELEENQSEAIVCGLPCTGGSCLSSAAVVTSSGPNQVDGSPLGAAATKWKPLMFNHPCYTVMIKCSCHFFEKCTLHIRCKILLLVSPRLHE